MNEQERFDYIKLYVETELKMVPNLRCVFIEPRTFDAICEHVTKANPDRLKLYFPQGMMPIENDGEGGLVAGFCIQRIVDQTQNMDDTNLARYLLYWITRMKVRLIKQADLESSPSNEKLVEELVEAEIKSTWNPPENWDGQTPTWE